MRGSCLFNRVLGAVVVFNVRRNDGNDSSSKVGNGRHGYMVGEVGYHNGDRFEGARLARKWKNSKRNEREGGFSF